MICAAVLPFSVCCTCGCRREDLEEVGEGGPFDHRELLEDHLAFGEELQDLLGAGVRRDLVDAACTRGCSPRSRRYHCTARALRMAPSACRWAEHAAHARARGHLDPGQRPGRSRRLVLVLQPLIAQHRAEPRASSSRKRPASTKRPRSLGRLRGSRITAYPFGAFQQRRQRRLQATRHRSDRHSAARQLRATGRMPVSALVRKSSSALCHIRRIQCSLLEVYPGVRGSACAPLRA